LNGDGAVLGRRGEAPADAIRRNPVTLGASQGDPTRPDEFKGVRVLPSCKENIMQGVNEGSLYLVITEMPSVVRTDLPVITANHV
jgi:hypothetical protein